MKNKLTGRQTFLQFEIGLYEAVLKTESDNITALLSLGYVFTNAGLYEKALQVDKNLARLLPQDSTIRYNLACDYSLLKRLDEAFLELELACRLGYNDFEHLEKDPDMDNLRHDPRYQQVLNKI